MLAYPRLVIPSIRDPVLVVSVVGNSSVAVRSAVGVLSVVGFSSIEVLKIGEAALAIVVVSSLPAVVVIRSLVVVVTSAVGIICSCHLRVSLPNRNLDFNHELYFFFTFGSCSNLTKVKQ